MLIKYNSNPYLSTNKNDVLHQSYFMDNIDIFDNFSFPHICVLCSKTPTTDNYEYDKLFEWNLEIKIGYFIFCNNVYTQYEPPCYRCCGAGFEDDSEDDKIIKKLMNNMSISENLNYNGYYIPYSNIFDIKNNKKIYYGKNNMCIFDDCKRKKKQNKKEKRTIEDKLYGKELIFNKYDKKQKPKQKINRNISRKNKILDRNYYIC